MDAAIIALAAAVAAGLTLFSGFGLGTLLMPVFALFFPLPSAVAATALVHLANNLFKSSLLLRHARRDVVLIFGIPAIVAALPGAALLLMLDTLPTPDWSLAMGAVTLHPTPIKLVLGTLILGFAAFEASRWSEQASLPRKWLPLGGAVSGFLGGLSGHQGAVRAVMLRRLDLDATQFAASQAMIALGVDIARLSVYGAGFAAVLGTASAPPASLLLIACVAAFTGSTVARLTLPRVKVAFVRWITTGLLLLVGAGLASGAI